jgi:ADP-ribose pyrophosphatase YjhB (NUDIX family)
MSADDGFTLGSFAVILDADDRVLVSHRNDLDLWNLPGGRVQPGELPDAAVIREVREETGLEVEVVCLTGVYGRADGQADLVFAFECRVAGGEIAATDEADRHEWFAVDELPVNTVPKQVARIRDALLRRPEPIFRTLSESSGREWLRLLDEAASAVGDSRSNEPPYATRMTSDPMSDATHEDERRQAGDDAERKQRQESLEAEQLRKSENEQAEQRRTREHEDAEKQRGNPA